jgi:hypothetical protein
MNPMTVSGAAAGPVAEAAQAHLQAARQFLLQAQGPDGGWGYRPEQPSAAEPTAWALLALQRHSAEGSACSAGQRGRIWLEQGQNADGSWSPWPGTPPGTWVTALAGLALLESKDSSTAVSRAARWLVTSWPADRKLLWNPLWWLLGRRINPQNPRLSGWSWTPATASWVEPTSVSILFLESLPGEWRPPGTERRLALARAMLRDRVCASGGWNTGNPRVYGVEGIPQVGPTAWALLALAGSEGGALVDNSLDWLEAHGLAFGGISSLALSVLALRAWGRSTAAFEQQLVRQCSADGWLPGVVAAAQLVLALAGAGGIPDRRGALR